MLQNDIKTKKPNVIDPPYNKCVDIVSQAQEQL